MRNKAMKYLVLGLSTLMASAVPFTGPDLSITVMADEETELNSDTKNTRKDENLKKEFLDALLLGLQRRWEYADSVNENVLSAEETAEYYQTLVSMEMECVEDYEGLETDDEQFNTIVEQYFKGINLSEKACNEMDDVYSSLLDGQAGAYNRAVALVDLAENYGLELSDDTLSEYKDTILECEGNNTDSDEIELSDDNEEQTNNLDVIEIEDTGLIMGAYEHVFLFVKIKNVGDSPISNISVSAICYDNNNETIIDYPLFTQDQEYAPDSEYVSKINPDETTTLYYPWYFEEDLVNNSHLEINSYTFTMNGKTHTSLY